MVADGRQRMVILTLKGLRAVLMLAGPGVLLGLLAARPGRPDFGGAPQVEPQAPQPMVALGPELSWYAPLWERDLKQPPIPPQPQRPPDPEPPALPRLLATCVSPEARLVHFIDNSGQIRLRVLGDSIDGYTISAIEAGRVELHRGEGRVWVEVPRPQGGP